MHRHGGHDICVCRLDRCGAVGVYVWFYECRACHTIWAIHKCQVRMLCVLILGTYTTVGFHTHGGGKKKESINTRCENINRVQRIHSASAHANRCLGCVFLFTQLRDPPCRIAAAPVSGMKRRPHHPMRANVFSLQTGGATAPYIMLD